MSEIVLAFHLAIVVFFVAGFPLGLVWNHRRFRYFHAGALSGVTLLMAAGIPCPLTVLEEALSDRSYQGSFLAAWLNRILYLEGFDPLHVLIGDLLFTALVLSSFWWSPVAKRK